MKLSDPKITSLLALLTVIGYYTVLLATEDSFFVSESFFVIFTIVFGFLVYISTVGFSSRELISTAGVEDMFQLRSSIFISLHLFSGLVAVAFTSLIVISTEMFAEEGSNPISRFLLFITVAFLLIHPIIEFKTLASPGEDSTMPAELIIERFLEFLTRKLHSTWLATIVAYMLTYVIPIVLLINNLHTQVLTAFVLWGITLPMINIGALAGTGLGEDLLRLKLLRKGRKLQDFNQLGYPNISFKDDSGKRKFIPSFKIGGVFLVIFAMQALITTAFFSLRNLIDAFSGNQVSSQTGASFMGGIVLVLILMNKGRGALKEFLGVWREGGFKVNVYPLFHPAFVLTGVVIASILEMFANLSSNAQEASVFGAFEVNNHPRLVIGFLILQNIIFILSSLLIYYKTPGSAERRLVYEVPEFYHTSEGWYSFYTKLQSKYAVAKLLEMGVRNLRNRPELADTLIRITEETIESPEKEVQIATTKTIYALTKFKKSKDERLYKLIIKSIEAESIGAQIYAIRALAMYTLYLSSEQTMDPITFILTKLYDKEVSIQWEASQGLKKVIEKNEELQPYVLSQIIRGLSVKSLEKADSALQFLNRATKSSEKIGQMALSTLAILLSAETVDNFETLLAAIKQVIRARPELSRELIQVIETELASPEIQHRKNALHVLEYLAEYVSAYSTTTQQMILQGITDEEEEVQYIAFNALATSVGKKTDISNVYSLIAPMFFTSSKEIQIQIIRVYKEIVEASEAFQNDIYEQLVAILSSPNESIKAHAIEVLGIIGENTTKLGENIYLVIEDELSSSDAIVVENTLSACNRIIKSTPTISNSLYKKIKNLLQHSSKQIQVETIQLYGKIATNAKRINEEIFQAIYPLRQDTDWEVRAAVYIALITTTYANKNLHDKFAELLNSALYDTDANVRQEIGRAHV